MAQYHSFTSLSKVALVSFIAGMVVPRILSGPESPSYPSTTTNVKPGSYDGYDWITNRTLAAQTIVETPFARAQFHTVKLESGKIVNDWMWFDEVDAVNVLVRRREGDFLVFRQEKYGIRGSTLAPIGGMVERGEEPLDTAKRELLEETGLVADTWHAMGSFRVAANRGAGILHTFFADGAYPDHVQKAGIAQGELEKQHVIYLQKEQLLASLLAGGFKEVKWAATVALSLIHMQHH